MPTDTFAITAAGNDTYAWVADGASWANCISGAGSFDDEPFGNGILSIAQTGGGSQYAIITWLRFDTSALSDTAVVSAANLLMYVEGKADPDNHKFAADFYDYGGSPATVGDWSLPVTGDAIATIDPDALTVGVVNTMALTGLTGINLTGFTGLRIGLKVTTQPTGDNFVDFTSFEGANQEPRLEVTWAEPSGQVLQASSDSVDGNWTDQSGGSSLFAAIDEDTASDSDYIRSELGPQSSGCRVKLEAGGDPAVSTGHEINWRIAKDTASGQTINMTVKLYQGGGNSLGGGTLIADFDRNNVTNTFTDFNETLSGGEADAITDYTDLYLEFWADVP